MICLPSQRKACVSGAHGDYCHDPSRQAVTAMTLRQLSRRCGHEAIFGAQRSVATDPLRSSLSDGIMAPFTRGRSTEDRPQQPDPISAFYFISMLLCVPFPHVPLTGFANVKRATPRAKQRAAISPTLNPSPVAYSGSVADRVFQFALSFVECRLRVEVGQTAEDSMNSSELSGAARNNS